VAGVDPESLELELDLASKRATSRSRDLLESVAAAQRLEVVVLTRVRGELSVQLDAARR